MTTEINSALKAQEAFIRRAASINAPFMLKGSYITRQYFDDINDRTPADLDWVYMNELDDDEDAAEVFNGWLIAVTELDLNDGVKYHKFDGDEYWQRIDYAMADDFPTLNIELWYLVDSMVDYSRFSLDISFNLNIQHSPVPLMYKPAYGDPFFIPQTVPLFLQVAWKIHQTLVRPRFKDLFDLMYLTQHITFDKNNCIRVLIDECNVSNIDITRLRYFFNYQINNLFLDNSIQENWDHWRHKKYSDVVDWRRKSKISDTGDKVRYITNPNKVPTKLSVFLEQFKNALQKSGLTIDLLASFENLVKNKS